MTFDPYLEDDVSFFEVPVLASQAGAGHLLDEELAAQTQAVLWR